MSDTNPTPEVGQVWADNDERTTYPEFTILEIGPWRDRPKWYATVQRGPRRPHIRIDRFADTGSRGYRYIGRAK